MVYKCSRCHYTTNIKCNYDRHKSRKTSCSLFGNTNNADGQNITADGQNITADDDNKELTIGRKYPSTKCKIYSKIKTISKNTNFVNIFLHLSIVHSLYQSIPYLSHTP